MEEFKEGDVVRLKGNENSPNMVVAFVDKFNTYGDSLVQKDWQYGCRWFDSKQEPRTHKFFAHELEKE